MSSSSIHFLGLEADIVKTERNQNFVADRHARRARVIFCELKAPGGSSTQWTLNSYDKQL